MDQGAHLRRRCLKTSSGQTHQDKHPTNWHRDRKWMGTRRFQMGSSSRHPTDLADQSGSLASLHNSEIAILWAHSVAKTCHCQHCEDGGGGGWIQDFSI
jgi:hypothetical protein